jgi:predicted RNA polymerase sigma factor
VTTATDTDTHGAIEAVFRIERAKLIAGLTRVVRDVGLAEELAQDALVAALEQWPRSGIPDKPGAWLMAAAKNRAIDRLRRARLIERKHQEIGHDLEIGGEGYTATAGDDWVRPQLCEEALRLGRVLAELAPEEAEVHGLVALMEIQASRLKARIRPDGAPILLLDQDRARWDQLLIRRGLAALARAEALDAGPGPYQLQAAIAACHARARAAADTDWARIAAIYEVLARLAPSPIVELNRAVAVAMASGPAAGLALVDRLADEPALKAYHLLPSVRGDLLHKLGRLDEARLDFERAASLTRNARERQLLLDRAAACGGAQLGANARGG